MKTRKAEIEGSMAVGDLLLNANILLASSTMCADDVDRSRRSGALSMAAPKRGTAYLEIGGVVVAEGRMARKRGKRIFVVTRTYTEYAEAGL